MTRFSPKVPRPPQLLRKMRQEPQTVFNKTFFRFVFSFAAVVAGVLALVLVLGVSAGLQ